MPDCWLEVSLHPGGPATGQLDPRANGEIVPKFHVALPASLAAFPMVTSTFRSTAALPMLD
jgi:hypothetical protein